MRWADAVKGTAAETEPFPLPGGFVDASGRPVLMALRALSDGEDAKVLEEARKFAIARGVAEPSEGHALFEKGVCVWTVFLAAVDIDSPPSARRPFFDSADDLERPPLTPEIIGYLYERQRALQDAHSPRRRDLPIGEMVSRIVKEVESPDDRFFSELSPYTQWRFHHFTCALAMSSPELKSLLSSPASSSQSSGGMPSAEPTKSAEPEAP